MNTPLLTWGCIVGMFVLILVVRLIHAAQLCTSGKHRFIDFISEREALYVPGDLNPRKVDDYDYEDFDDL